MDDDLDIIYLRVITVDEFAGKTGLLEDDLYAALEDSEVSFGSNSWTLFSAHQAHTMWRDFLDAEGKRLLHDLGLKGIYLAVQS